PGFVAIDLAVIVIPFAIKAPPPATSNLPAFIAGFKPPVFSVVVPAPPAIVSAPPTSRLFAAIVYVTVDTPELNVTFPPNSWVRLAKVMVREAAELNVIGAAKLQEADVDEFVHDPDAVQEPAAVDVM